MLLQFFKQANRKFILVIISFILLFRLGLALFLEDELVSVFLAFIIHTVSSVGINGILVKTQVVKRYSVLPLFFLLLISSYPIFYEFSNYDLPFVLGILALVGLSKIYPAEKVNERLFNSAFLLTLMAYFYPTTLVFTIPIVICFQFVFDLIQVRKFFLVLTALFIPIYLGLTFEYAINDGLWSSSYLTKFINIPEEWPSFQIKSLAGLGMIGIVGLLGITDLQAYIQQKAIIARTFILYIGLLGLVYLISLILLKSSPEAYIFLVIPLVVVLSNYFDHVKARLIHQVLFALTTMVTLFTPFVLN